jgi:hypothetical protein
MKIKKPVIHISFVESWGISILILIGGWIRLTIQILNLRFTIFWSIGISRGGPGWYF